MSNFAAVQTSVSPELLATIEDLFKLVTFSLEPLELVHPPAKISVAFLVLLYFLLKYLNLPLRIIDCLVDSTTC
jgi:hypothetical protein